MTANNRSTSDPTPRVPRGLKTSGKALWRALHETYELDVWEQQQVTTACRIADRLDDIAQALADAPLTIRNAKGEEVTHPLLVEQRMSSLAMQRIIAGLRLPDDVGHREQRRGGARGVYAKSGLSLVKEA